MNTNSREILGDVLILTIYCPAADKKTTNPQKHFKTRHITFVLKAILLKFHQN
jgi:hypothetical protein